MYLLVTLLLLRSHQMKAPASISIISQKKSPFHSIALKKITDQYHVHSHNSPPYPTGSRPWGPTANSSVWRASAGAEPPRRDDPRCGPTAGTGSVMVLPRFVWGTMTGGIVRFGVWAGRSFGLARRLGEGNRGLWGSWRAWGKRLRGGGKKGLRGCVE